MDRTLWVKSALLVLIVLSVAVGGCSTGSSPSQAPLVGSTAPDFQLQNLDGKSVSLRDLRGKAVMLNFWASWCGPCREEMPLIQEVYEDKKWSETGLEIVAVNIGESDAVVKKFMADNGLTFPVLLDTSQDVAKGYNVRGIPTTFFIDNGGIIRGIKIGALLSRGDLESRLREIMP